MFLYAFEIGVLLLALLAGVVIYRLLIRSPNFARFLNETVDTADVDAEAQLDSAASIASRYVEQTEKDVARKSQAAARVRKRLP
jgi:hypothetical protein